ncbi:MAG: hypothetical protein PHF41_12305 [Massilibacteroides sp.]|nr:hypothetical protein [Massilibacteroides sp.]
MSAANTKVQEIIESTFTSALEKLNNDGSIHAISDLYVQADRESGDLSIYDDNESLIEKTIIFDWVDNKQPEEVFLKHTTAIIKSALVSLASKEAFEQPCIVKPFSVNLSDEDFAIIEELLFIDDEILRLDDPLLKDLDADLDDFLDKLLSDIE